MLADTTRRITTRLALFDPATSASSGSAVDPATAIANVAASVTSAFPECVVRIGLLQPGGDVITFEFSGGGGTPSSSTHSTPSNLSPLSHSLLALSGPPVRKGSTAVVVSKSGPVPSLVRGAGSAVFHVADSCRQVKVFVGAAGDVEPQPDGVVLQPDSGIDSDSTGTPIRGNGGVWFACAPLHTGKGSARSVGVITLRQKWLVFLFLCMIALSVGHVVD